MGESVAFPYLACLILRTASGCDIVAVKFPGACPGFPDFKTSLTKFGMKDAKPIKTPMGTNGHLDLDTGGKSVDQKVCGR